MKKKLLVLLVAVFILAGCGTKEETVTCTMQEADENMTMDAKIKYVIKDAKVYSADLEIVVAANSDELDLDAFKQSYEELFANMKGAKGITYSSEVKDEKYDFKMNIIYSKLIETEVDGFSNYEKEIISDRDVKIVSAQLTKENLEAEGYTCEIK